MFSKTFRATLALQIARATIPGAAIGTFFFVNACTDQQDRSVVRAVAPDGPSLATSLNDGTYFGGTVALPVGDARTYVTIQHGAPTEIGVELSRAAVAGMPAVLGHPNHTEHTMTDNAWELPLPSEAGATAYRSVNIDWMPNGHDAPYNRPHFDFHFYVIPTAERLAIQPTDPAWAEKASTLPPQQYWPARYFPLSMLVNVPAPQVTVPAMGLHWLDVASPELHGAEFTHTFFYGSYNGALIFDEPMITKQLLDSRETVDLTLPPAPDYATTGFRAGGYRVYWNEATGGHRVALTQLAEK